MQIYVDAVKYEVQYQFICDRLNSDSFYPSFEGSEKVSIYPGHDVSSSSWPH